MVVYSEYIKYSIDISFVYICLSVCQLDCLFCQIDFEVMYLSIEMHRSLPVCCLLLPVWWTADCILFKCVCVCVCLQWFVCLSLGNSCEKIAILVLHRTTRF